MPERTEQPDQQPTPAPELPPLYRQPATVEACQQDYAEGADIRRRLGWID